MRGHTPWPEGQILIFVNVYRGSPYCSVRVLVTRSRRTRSCNVNIGYVLASSPVFYYYCQTFSSASYTCYIIKSYYHPFSSYWQAQCVHHLLLMESFLFLFLLSVWATELTNSRPINIVRSDVRRETLSRSGSIGRNLFFLSFL